MRYILINELRRIGKLPSILKNADDVSDEQLIMAAISVLLKNIKNTEDSQ